MYRLFVLIPHPCNLLVHFASGGRRQDQDRLHHGSCEDCRSRSAAGVPDLQDTVAGLVQDRSSLERFQKVWQLYEKTNMVGVVLKNGLNILGIDVPEKM